MITIADFFEDLRNTIHHGAIHADHQYSSGVFLEKVMEEYIEDQGLVPNRQLLTYQKQGRGRCDGYDFNELKNELSLFIVDYSSATELERLTNTDIERLKKAVIQFYENACDHRFLQGIDESHDGYEMAQFIYDKRAQIRTLKILIVTNKQLSLKVKEVKDTEHQLPINITYDVWDLTRFYQLATSKGHSEDIEIDLNDLGQAIPALPASQIDSISSYLCVIQGNTLADLYERFGAKLLESNVRSFLQFRANINKGIRKTIQTAPEKFFSYNNGITATADEVTFDDQNHIVGFKNLQIVNGGQTTVALYQTRLTNKADLGQIRVQMKLNLIEDKEQQDEVVAAISRFANSQNKINDSDFFSNHPFHRRFEEQSKRIWSPAKAGELKQSKWFYERARGSYLNAQANLTAAQKKAYQTEHPKNQMITKTDLAKLHLIFDGRPYDAVKGAEIAFRNFSEYVVKIWVDQEQAFNDEYFKQCVAQLITLQTVKDSVYANKSFLGNTKAIVSAYTVALFVALVSEDFLELDYARIWNEQSRADGVRSELVKLSVYIYNYLDIQALNLNMALLSYAKSQKAYTAVKEECLAKYQISDVVKRQMKKRFSQEEKVKEGKREQKIDNELELMTHLINLGATKWADIVEQSQQHGWLTPTELKLVQQVPRYMAGQLTQTPNLKQLQKIEALLMNLEDHDYYVFENA